MLKREWQAILNHKFFIVVIIALALIPAIYNYIFLGSMWDPYGKLNDLPVAVVNLDRTSELNGKKLKLGDNVINEMKKSKELDYHFVSKDEASKGIKKGDYYMVVTFPENFSENATTLMEKKPKTVQLDYQTTRGHNYISSKMSESAMNQLKSEVAKNITETYTKEIFAKLGDMKSGMTEASDGSVKLADGTSSALTGSKNLTNNLEKLSSSGSTFTNGADKLNWGLNNYVSGVNQAANGGQQLSSGTTQFVNGTQQLAAGTQTLANKSKELATGLTELEQKTALSPEQQNQISELQKGLNELNAAIQAGAQDTSSANAVKNDLVSVKKSLEDTQAILSALVPNQIQAMTQTTTYKNLTPDQQAELNSAILSSAQNTLSPVQTSIASITTSLTDVSNQLIEIQNQTKQLAQNSNVALPGANTIISQLSTGFSEINNALTNQVTPGFNQYINGVNQTNFGAQQLANKSKELQNGTMQLTYGLSQLQANGSTLTTGSNQLADGAQQIVSGAQQLANGGTTLTSGLETLNTGTNSLSTALTKANDTLSKTNNSNENAKKIAAPLELKHTDHDNVPENGAGMTPYMINVALFIGTLATNVVIGIGFSGEKWKSGHEFMLAKIGTNGLVALLQGVIVWGAVALLGLRPNHLWEMLLSVLLISFAYMAINTFFLTAFGKIGEFLMIVVLVLQLATSAGTYPLQLAPKIYQVISPWLPMTYGLKMLRETIGLNGEILSEVILFVAIIAVFTFALSFFKKYSRFA